MTQFARRCSTWMLLACLAGPGLVGCSRNYYRTSADKEVYGIIEARSRIVPGMVSDFTIEQAVHDVLADCPRAEPPATEDAEPPSNAERPYVLSLARALEVAALNSRRYQTEKENVYRQVLSLTLQRYAFRPQFFGALAGQYDEVDMGESRRVSGDSDFGFSWLLSTGARITAALSTSVSQFVKGDPQRAAASALRITVTQPLLQGAGISVTEGLTQAERDTVYQIRSFVRFRRTFFVSILAAYYRVLEDAQVVENERRNLESLMLLRERAEAMADAGEFSGYQVDQVRQRELEAGDRIVRVQQNYESSLDNFKVTLGLPAETPLILDPAELSRLTEEGDLAIPLSAERIQELAMAHRLDLEGIPR